MKCDVITIRKGNKNLNLPSVDSEHVRLGRFLAGREKEPSDATILLPP